MTKPLLKVFQNKGACKILTPGILKEDDGLAKMNGASLILEKIQSEVKEQGIDLHLNVLNRADALICSLSLGSIYSISFLMWM